jgi:hypothetical protein
VRTLTQNKDPTKNRKPGTDVDGDSLKFGQQVEILNGVGYGYVILAKVMHVGSTESVIEYEDGRRILSIENKKLKIRINVRV